MNGETAIDEGRLNTRLPHKLTLISIVGMLVIWVLVALIAGKNEIGNRMVPGPIDVATAFPQFANYWTGDLGVTATQVGGEVTWQGTVLGLFYNTFLTLVHAVGGVVIGTVLGLLLAVATSWWSPIRQALAFPAHFVRLLPLLAMAPLFALWFGGENHTGAVLFVALTAFAFVFPIGLAAIASVPPYYEQYARSLGASGLQSYLRVIVPAAIPGIRGGVTLAVGFGWSAAIVAEYMTYPYGLGAIVKNAAFFGSTDLLGALALLTLCLAATSFVLVRSLLDWVTRWAE